MKSQIFALLFLLAFAQAAPAVQEGSQQPKQGFTLLGIAVIAILLIAAFGAKKRALKGRKK